MIILDFTKESHHKQDYYMKCAARVAMHSNCVNYRHGCIIINRKTGEILASGCNHYTNKINNYFTCHSEIDALQKVRWIPKCERKNLDLYVVRIGQNNDSLKFSKPCSGCAEAIMKFGIRKIFYSTDENYTTINSMFDLTCEHKPIRNKKGGGIW